VDIFFYQAVKVFYTFSRHLAIRRLHIALCLPKELHSSLYLRRHGHKLRLLDKKTCPFLAPGRFSLKSANAQFADERASIMNTLQGLKTNEISSIFIPMDLA
jgi:hypothetical protein